MISQDLYPQHPYAATRPASPRTFVGYREGNESLQSIRDRLTAAGAGSPSYWIAGGPKSGKSSFLRQLEDLLRNQPRGRGQRLRPVPLYITCARHGSPLSLCRGLLSLLEKTAAARSRNAAPPDAAVPPPRSFQLLATEGPAANQRLLPLLREDLTAAAAVLDGSRSVFVLLIDDLDAAMAGGWGQKLIPTLRALVTESLAGCEPRGCEGLNVRLVLAGSPDLATVPQFKHLLLSLDEIKLRPLALSDIDDLIHVTGKAFNGHLAEAILRATGGQPWLTQLVLEQFTATHRPEREFADWLRSFDWARLRGDTEQRQALEAWLARLPEGGFTILAHLTLAGTGMTLPELAEAIRLDEADLAPKLEKMTGRGLIYRPVQRPDAYQVCEVVKRWYLEETGGSVFVDEIERRQSARLAAQPGAKPFALLLSLDHRVMVADGLYTRCFALDNRFTEEAQKLYRAARQAVTVQHLADLGSNLESLGRNYVDEDWRIVWEDYFTSAERARIRFILQTGDQELLDFPVELLPFEQGFLGLRVPVFKEVIGLRRREPYRLAAGCLPRGEPLNVLLVGAGGGGKYGTHEVPALPGVAQEISGICAVLRAAAAQGSLLLGKIVVLTDAPDLAIDGALVKKATVDELKQVLGGASRIGFHLLHFSGHYGFGGNDQTSGLWLPGGDGVELFSLANLFQHLESKKVNFAFFNGCSSGNHRPSPTHYLGAPYTCLRAGVPAVIGMRWPIGDGQACHLGIDFYQRLAVHGLPEVALLETRKWAETAYGGTTLWAAPVMLTC
jgi:hypothetical protein